MSDMDNSVSKSMWFIASIVLLPGALALLIAFGMLFA